MPFWDWDDSGPTDESTVRRFGLAELGQRLALRLRPFWRTLVAGIALLAVAVGAELLGPILLRRLIDHDLSAAAQGESLGGIFRTAGLYLLLLVVGTFATYRQTVMAAGMGLELIRRLKQEIFGHLLDLGADFFDHNPPGRLLARVESDAERLQVLFSEVALSLLRSLVLLFGTLGVMFWTSPKITLAVLALIAPFFASALLFLKWMRPLYGKTRGLYSKLSTFVTEYAQATPILQVYDRRDWTLSKLEKVASDRRRAETRSELSDYTFWSFFFTVEVFAVMLILYLGFGRHFGGVLTLGTVVLFVEYTRRLFFPIVMFAEQLHFMQKASASADRVFSILETKSQVVDRPCARESIPREWREIAFEQVSFAYAKDPLRGTAGSRAGSGGSLLPHRPRRARRAGRTVRRRQVDPDQSAAPLL
ncbi:MAG: ABC transporter ATP-binding protein [Candidatus Eisenbacteria bacterium]